MVHQTDALAQHSTTQTHFTTWHIDLAVTARSTLRNAVVIARGRARRRRALRGYVKRTRPTDQPCTVPDAGAPGT
jgi:hypothetical protein